MDDMSNVNDTKVGNDSSKDDLYILISKADLFVFDISDALCFDDNPDKRKRAAAELKHALEEFHALQDNADTRSRMNYYSLSMSQLDALCKGKLFDVIVYAYEFGFIKGRRYEKHNK